MYRLEHEMSLTFDPDANAAPNGTWDTTFLVRCDIATRTIELTLV